MKKLLGIVVIYFLWTTISFSDENRYNDYKSKLSSASTEQKFVILKEISFALEFENDVISSCVGYIKLWKDIKGEICKKAIERLNGIMNLLGVLGSSEYKSSFIEVYNKIDKVKLNKLQNETEKNNSSLSDNLAKLNFLVQNL
tara:strand:- start:253 stop:681 length:429 start_codon:yes stop_codon:yes gene_type:complete